MFHHENAEQNHNREITSKFLKYVNWRDENVYKILVETCEGKHKHILKNTRY
jgi:hypothetical protein